MHIHKTDGRKVEAFFLLLLWTARATESASLINKYFHILNMSHLIKWENLSAHTNILMIELHVWWHNVTIHLATCMSLGEDI